MNKFYDRNVQFYSDYDQAVELIKECEHKLNEKRFLYASELGFPALEWDPDWDLKYEIKEILEDGTVLMDWEPTSDNIMKILTLESKLERHFMDLEERIDNCWV